MLRLLITVTCCLTIAACTGDKTTPTDGGQPKAGSGNTMADDDHGERKPLGAGFREKVMFATLNMDEKAGEAVTPRLRQIVAELTPYRGKRGQG